MHKTATLTAVNSASIPLNAPDIEAASLLPILNNLPVAVVLTNNEAKIVYCNLPFNSLFGYAHTFTSINSRGNTGSLKNHLFTFVNVEDTHLQLLKFISDKQKISNHSVELITGDHLSVSYTPVSEEGMQYHMFSFSAFRKNETEIKDSLTQKSLYDNIFSHLPSDIVVLSTNFTYLFFNPASNGNEPFKKWLIGKTDFDYCSAFNKDVAIAERRHAIYQQVLLTKKSIEWEERFTDDNDLPEYHLRKVSPVLDDLGQVKMLIGYGMDITERKKIETRIQLSEKRYRDLFNYSQAMICTHDLEGNFITVNPALCEAVGFTQKQIIGQNLSNYLPEEDIRGFKPNYLDAIAGEAKTKGVFRIAKRNGEKIYLLYENFKVVEEGNAPYVIGFAQDITDRITTEKHLKVAKKVTEETALLKERFLANMSHEIRTPMNGILGMTNLLQKTYLNPEQKNFLRIINDSAQNLLTIINDILDIEKIAAGEVNIECIPFDVVYRTQSILSMFNYSANAKGIDCVFENRLGNSLIIEGDPTRYNQVINNLVSNAIKFTSEGSVRLLATIERQTDRDIELQFSVIDTGIGIEENKLEKIFEPFTQAYPETTRKYGGTGLGLAITKNLVELQKGSLSVKSKLGYGSKFTFTIKYKKCVENDIVISEPETPKPVRNELGALKVLLAEDNEVNQLLARSILMYWGLETRTATTGIEVMELLNAEDFDVILMDIQMPEKNGLEATIEIRNLADRKKRNIPIIALTANALKGEEKKYIAVGMDDFLTKPFKENDLYEVIMRVLENKGAFGRDLEPGKPNQLTTSMITNDLPVDNGRLYDMASLNEISRGNKDFMITLAKIFLNTIPVNCSEMAEAADSKNWDKVSALAHKLKSTIDTMNIKSIKQDIRAIEINAKNKAELSNVCHQIEKVNMVIEKTAEQLKEQFGL